MRFYTRQAHPFPETIGHES
ncbi:hypothetical protein JMJ77_0013511, partial [Colletotrichum scovillei]